MGQVGQLQIKLDLDPSGFKRALAESKQSLGTIGREVSTQSQILRAEFGTAIARLDDTATASDRLRIRVDFLGNHLAQQSRLVASLSEAHRRSVLALGENDQATQRLAVRLARAREEEARIENQIRQTNRELENQSRATQRANINFRDMGEQMRSIGAGLFAGVTLPILGVGVASTKMAMDAVESENLFEVSMGNMAQSARAWSEELNASLGLNAYELRKNTGLLFAMFDSMKMSEKSAYDMSTGLTQLSYDMASFYNLKPEEAFEKLRAGITGEAEPLKALGILIDENTIKTYAYTNGIAKQGSQLSEQQKVLARYGAIMEQTAMAQGDMARTMDSPTNQLRIMQEEIKKVSIDFGMALLPAMKDIIAIAKPMVGDLKEVVHWFTGLDESSKKAALGVAGLVLVAGPLLFLVGSLTIALPGLGAAVGLLTGPVGWVVLAVTAMGAAWIAWGDDAQRAIDKVESRMKNFRQWLRDHGVDVATEAEMYGTQAEETYQGMADLRKASGEETVKFSSVATRSFGSVASATGKAKDVLEEFKKELVNTASYMVDMAGKKWELYQAKVTKTTSETEIAAEKLKYQKEKLSALGNEITLIQEKHDLSIKVKGLESDATHQLSLQLMDLQIEYAKLRKEIEDTTEAESIWAKFARAGKRGDKDQANTIAAAIGLGSAIGTIGGGWDLASQDAISSWAGSSAKINLPSFDVGGLVPGREGAPMLAVVHGQEYITPAGQKTPGGMIATFHIYDATDPHKVAAVVKRQVESMFRQSALEGAR